MAKIFRVNLTGAQCSGKSSCTEQLKQHFTERGFLTFFVPETASILILGGMKGQVALNEQSIVEVQSLMLTSQIRLEESFLRLAEIACVQNKKPAIVFFDRGVHDCAAYTPPSLWSTVLAGASALLGYENLLTDEILSRRYDVVVHLESAILTLEHDQEQCAKLWSTNPARGPFTDQTVSIVKARDAALKRAYCELAKHPRRVFCSGAEGLQKKILAACTFCESVVSGHYDDQAAGRK